MNLGLFDALADVLPREPVRVTGTWSSKAQLRYESSSQLGSGEGPYKRVVDWRWDGVLDCALPLASIELRMNEAHLTWLKSAPPVVGLSFFVLDRPPDTGPPASTLVGPDATTTGTPHLFARIDTLTLGIVLVPQSAIRVGRNRLWRLREELAARLPVDLRRLMTERRTGTVTLPNEGGRPAGTRCR